MTALATGLALLPLVTTGQKPGHEIEYPLAVVILGGLFTSTILTLILLPPLYSGLVNGNSPQLLDRSFTTTSVSLTTENPRDDKPEIASARSGDIGYYRWLVPLLHCILQRHF